LTRKIALSIVRDVVALARSHHLTLFGGTHTMPAKKKSKSSKKSSARKSTKRKSKK
jgi:hypothetical protein